MNTKRTIGAITASLLAGLTATTRVTAEEPRTTARGREIEQRQAQREAERYHEDLEEAHRHFEAAAEKYRDMMREYDALREARGRFERGPSPRDVEARIDDLTERQLQLRRHEVEVRTRMEQLNVSGRPEEAERLQLEMIELHREIEMTQLELEKYHRELDRVHERREIDHMRERLEYIAHWREVAFEPQQAVILATQSLVEIRAGSQDVRGAVELLESLLERIEWLGARTALRFALKELYTELDEPDRAVEQLKRVILENSNVRD